MLILAVSTRTKLNTVHKLFITLRLETSIMLTSLRVKHIKYTKYRIMHLIKRLAIPKTIIALEE